MSERMHTAPDAPTRLRLVARAVADALAGAVAGALASAVTTARTLAHALRDFGRGFVGETRLPRERHAACCALADRANGRGRCC